MHVQGIRSEAMYNGYIYGLAAACPTVSLSPPNFDCTDCDLRRPETLFFGDMPPDPPSGRITLLSVQQSDLGGAFLTWYIVGATTHNREKEMYEDIDAPSV